MNGTQWYHPIATISVSLLFISVSYWADGNILVGLIVAALILLLFTIVLIGILIWQSYSDKRTEMIGAISDLAANISRLDDAKMEVLTDQFPHIRYHARGRIARPYFEDTDVPIEIFQRFLTDCNNHYIAPQRNWQGGDRPEWAWIQIYKWLVDRKLIIPNSAIGNTSHHWINEDCYKRVVADYWIAGKSPAQVSDQTFWGSRQQQEGEEEPAGTPQQAYAYDTEPLPHLKKVPGRG